MRSFINIYVRKCIILILCLRTYCSHNEYPRMWRTLCFNFKGSLGIFEGAFLNVKILDLYYNKILWNVQWSHFIERESGREIKESFQCKMPLSWMVLLIVVWKENFVIVYSLLGLFQSLPRSRFFEVETILKSQHAAGLLLLCVIRKQ